MFPTTISPLCTRVGNVAAAAAAFVASHHVPHTEPYSLPHIAIGCYDVRLYDCTGDTGLIGVQREAATTKFKTT